MNAGLDHYPAAATGRDIVKLGLTVAVAVLAIATILSWWFRTPEPWAPLGPFPQQTVSHPNGDTDPIFDTTEAHIHVTAVKCRGDQPVQVTGTLAWRRISPAGYSTPPVEFPPSVQPAGCVTTTFANPIPTPVTADVCTNGTSVWQIAGTETPVGQIDETGTVTARTGVPLGWETEPFTLTCTKETS